jgi:hypothetical protein
MAAAGVFPLRFGPGRKKSEVVMSVMSVMSELLLQLAHFALCFSLHPSGLPCHPSGKGHACMQAKGRADWADEAQLGPLGGGRGARTPPVAELDKRKPSPPPSIQPPSKTVVRLGWDWQLKGPYGVWYGVFHA